MMRVVALGALLLLTACTDFGAALTGHARPAAEAAGYRLVADDLGRLMAESPMPDSVLTERWAGEMARLWADYVVLAQVYVDPDSTRSLDYTGLMTDGRYLASIAVYRYRDSVVLADIEPGDDEIRHYLETRQPFTRLDVRRLVLSVPVGANESLRDSLYDEARSIRRQLVGGADFVEVSRQRSTEPPQSRGRVLSYQGHEDFPPAADSVVFSLLPGEISPAIATPEAMYVYRIEGRRAPDFEAARDQVHDLMIREREARRLDEAMDHLVDDARISIRNGAPGVARQMAEDPHLAAGVIPDGVTLATWDGGDLDAGELRALLRVRGSFRDMFADATDEELETYIFRLAQDEILIAAAERSGVEATAAEREKISRLLADQLSLLAVRHRMTRQFVTDPAFDLTKQSHEFVQRVLREALAIPWLGEFHVVLEQVYPVRIHDSGVEVAARKARELRAAGMGTNAAENESVETVPDRG
jgi:hypothetical protein